MTRLPVFRKTLRDQRVPALGWGLAMLILAYLHILMYPQYKEGAGALNQNAFIRALSESAGGVGTPAGFLNTEFFAAAPLLVLIFAIIAGTGLLAGEESGGTLDLVLAQPLRRRRLVIEKCAALALLLTLVSLASLPGFLLAMLTVDFDISILWLAEACLSMAPFVFVYAALALLAGSLLGSRTAAAIATIAAVVAAYFVNALGLFVDALDAPRRLSPFYWTDYGSVLTGAFDWTRPVIFTLVALAFALVTLRAFERHDIGASAGWLRRRRTANLDGPKHVDPGLSALDMIGPARSAWPTFRRTLREQRIPFASWGVGVLLLGFVTILVYPQYKDAFAAFDESGAFKELAGEVGMVSSPAGYFMIEFFSYVPLLFVIAGVIAGAGAIAGEEGAGTLELVLAQPLARRRLLLEKALALAALLLVSVAVSLPALLLARALIDFDLGVGRMVTSVMSIVPLAWLYLGIALFSSAAIPSRTMGTMLTIGAAVAAYFLNTLGAYVDALDGLRMLSPFYWSDFSRVLVHGPDLIRSGIFVGLALILMLAAMEIFQRRDLASTWSLRQHLRHPPREPDGRRGASLGSVPRPRQDREARP